MTIVRFALTASFALVAGIFVIATAFADAPAKPAGFSLSSPAFVDGGQLPVEFTCDGNRASPPLQWSDPPAGTKSFAIAMHHTPGPGDMHVYMVVYNIPASARALAKNARDVGVFGINTVNGKQEYTPPCSKGPGEKTYTLTIYALSAEPAFNVAPNAVTMELLLEAIKNKTLATAAINVTYDRTGKTPGAAAGNAPGAGPAPDRHAGPPELQRALKSLTLTEAQQAKVDTIVQQFHQKQEQARSELLKQMKEVLDARQYEQLESSFKKPPSPDAPPGNEDRPPRN